MEGLKVVHALPGRVRLKVAKVKGHPEMAGNVRKKLAAVPGIKQVETNAATGSVLVHYDQEALQAAETLGPLAAILGEFCPEVEALSLVGHLASLADLEQDKPLAGGLVTGVRALNAKISSATGGLDLKLLAPLTLLFFGVRSLWAAEKTTVPAWHDYFWFAFSTLVMLNRGWFEGPQADTVPVPVTHEGKGKDLKKGTKAG